MNLGYSKTSIEKRFHLPWGRAEFAWKWRAAFFWSAHSAFVFVRFGLNWFVLFCNSVLEFISLVLFISTFSFSALLILISPPFCLLLDYALLIHSGINFYCPTSIVFSTWAVPLSSPTQHYVDSCSDAYSIGWACTPVISLHYHWN